jgi:hypothetical protein
MGRDKELVASTGVHPGSFFLLVHDPWDAQGPEHKIGLANTAQYSLIQKWQLFSEVYENNVDKQKLLKII